MRIPRPDLKKRFLCTICKARTCELIVENYDESPIFCPYAKELRKWEEIPEGAKNTEQQVQADSFTPNSTDFLEYCEIMKLKPTVRDQIIFMAGMTFQSLKGGKI